MKWPIFTPAHKVPREPVDEEVEHFVRLIESRSPREYNIERLTHYYNYRTISAYRKPLLSLLETISRSPSFRDDLGITTREIFLSLKRFYDPKNRLTLAEAVADKQLRRKFEDLLLYFYGRNRPSADEIGASLNELIFHM
ncbi:hypothetical protein TRIP_B210032 [uncultured Desulfatiglans sp.]|uniref:Uncharacterized protein n=1 Tax=Uncultured Desulfatiglans sp. TaxID=1748965 RepID=A0A653A3U8_UNCDX|nr:hypothetical protein TRIP_B210032 [uncultured Desulfatiglans sp.]